MELTLPLSLPPSSGRGGKEQAFSSFCYCVEGQRGVPVPLLLLLLLLLLVVVVVVVVVVLLLLLLLLLVVVVVLLVKI